MGCHSPRRAADGQSICPELLALGSLGAVFLLYLADIRNPKQIMWVPYWALTVLFVLGTLYFSYDPTGFERLEYKDHRSRSLGSEFGLAGP